jgi:diguanylate cyclase (GGDEF)-like protein
MARNGKQSGNRVARRLFTSLALASLVPIGTSAVLTVVETHRTLQARADSELRQASQDLGERLFERLRVAENMLSALSADAPFDAIMFDAVQIRTTQGTQAVEGVLADASDFELVAPGSARLVVERRRGGQRILLARASESGLSLASLAPAYFWKTDASLPRGTNLCVFAQEIAEPVHCTERLSASALRALADSRAAASSGSAAWRDGDTSFAAAYSQLPLPPRFTAPPWSIVASRPAPTTVDSLRVLGDAYSLAVGISCLVVLLLAIVQSRRILYPLGQLVEGTRRIAARKFATRFGLHGDDEFRELANAMNAMTEQLGRQFETLTALRDIDGLILSSEQADGILDAVLARVATIVQGCDIAVLLLDPDNPELARLYRGAVPTGTEQRSAARCPISQELRRWLSQRDGGSLELGAAVRKHLPAFGSVDDGCRVFVKPLVHGEQLRGAMFAVFESGAVTEDADLDSLRELANRIAVATSAAEREQQLFRRAHFDALTGLPNRQLCHDRLGQALAVARRQEHKLAVLFIDLDGFKHVNDSLGHAAGDQLLREASVRLRSAVRATDTVARLGGDEYVVILPSVHGPLEVEVLVGSIMEALKWPFLVNGEQCLIGASIGVTMFPDDGGTAEELLRKADTAMYSAKQGGRARYVFFAKEMDERIQDRRMLQSDLRSALANRELFLVYQPQIDLATGEVVCAEALLRWRHPTRGIISPSIVLPVLEETGLLESIGRWTLQTALEELARWKGLGLSIRRVAINVATPQLFDKGFVELVDECLQSSKLPGHCLEIELTEASLVTDFERADRVLRALSGRGIGTAIDDFGTGYSSLGYLKELSFDRVKIDRTFIEGLPDEKSLAIVKAVFGIAHSLHKEVIAEGIESHTQRRQLVKLKCEIGQGFLFCRPLLGDAFGEWLAQQEATRLLKQVFASNG